jgi:hypothetical protein
MTLRRAFIFVALISVCVPTGPVWACPVCNTGTGKQVRAQLFDTRFTPNLLAILSPFPLFFGIGAAMYYGIPSPRKNKTAKPVVVSSTRLPHNG